MTVQNTASVQQTQKAPARKWWSAAKEQEARDKAQTTKDMTQIAANNAARKIEKARLKKDKEDKDQKWKDEKPKRDEALKKRRKEAIARRKTQKDELEGKSKKT